MNPERFKQVRDVLEAALEKEPDERSRFLDEACSSDPELRAEVDSLIARQDEAEDYLEMRPYGSQLESRSAGVSSLEPGARLGTYEILEPVGAGGMGEVYRARDTRLDRHVAIKVLPEAFAKDKDRLARFKREARLLAQLNHSNIATLHGLEEHLGQLFLVMEFVEGKTLRERIAKCPLPVEESVLLFTQIAEGLDAAHEKGIVHRDLKPANIKIGPDGQVKILDFGLAKAIASGTQPQRSEAPTATKGTALGLILGTAPYMSPEQASGKPVDKRTDIWAFGCCLFEALTGQVAFLGETASETIAKILEKEPDWSRLPQRTPKTLVNLTRRCLEKDTRRRQRDIGDARVELDTREAATTPEASSRRAQAIGLILGLSVGVLGILLLWRSTSSDEAQPVITRFAVAAEGVLPRAEGKLLALSCDGRTLAHMAVRDRVSQIYRRDMEKFEEEPIRGTENGNNPFFSPDGAWLGFTTRGGVLKKISLAGGPPVTLCDCGAGDGTWGSNDVIVFQKGGVLAMVPASGGDPTDVTTLGEGETIHRQAEILPGGKALLFTAVSGSIDNASIEVHSFDTGERRRLVGGAHPFYAPTGHVVFVREQSLWAIAFDAETLTTKGEAIPLVEGVRVERGGATQFALADNGTLAYVPIEIAGHGVGRALEWVDRQGNRTPLEQEQRDFSHPRFSPDGRRILLQIAEEGQKDVWLYDVERDTLARQTFDAISGAPIWTPDGARLTFTSYTGTYEFYWKLAEGGEGREQLLDLQRASSWEKWPRSWSPDGMRLAFQDVGSETGADIWILLLDEQLASPFLATSANEDWPVFSPDGQWIVYESDESGQREVYLTDYPGAEHKHKVSIAGGGNPRWKADGSELFYISEEGELMAVTVATTPTLQLGAPHALFELSGRDYDVHPSGEHFLIVSTEREAEPGQINIVLNWFEELKRLVPTDE